MKSKLLSSVIILLAVFAITACSDDENRLPTFGKISITPEKAVYNVGDEIILSIEMLSAPDASLKDASYWWYYDYATGAMFTEFEDNKSVSIPIVLTKSGKTELAFWGKLTYGNYDWEQIHETISIVVQEN